MKALAQAPLGRVFVRHLPQQTRFFGYDMNRISLTVSGMKCGGCEKTVQDAATSVSGVISAKAFHQENRVEVVFDDALVSPTVIQKAIADKGYPIL